MEDTYELTALRSIRLATSAIRDLENQSSATSKRYKRGIKTLSSYIYSVEASLDDGGCLEGTAPWESMPAKLRDLMANPCLNNIEEDNSV